jgi:uncharacterized protein (DUF1684 family)
MVTASRHGDYVLVSEELNGREFETSVGVVVAKLPVIVATCGTNLEGAVNLDKAKRVGLTTSDLNDTTKRALGIHSPSRSSKLDTCRSPTVYEVAKAEAAAAVATKDQESTTNG